MEWTNAVRLITNFKATNGELERPFGPVDLSTEIYNLVSENAEARRNALSRSSTKYSRTTPILLEAAMSASQPSRFVALSALGILDAHLARTTHQELFVSNLAAGVR